MLRKRLISMVSALALLLSLFTLLPEGVVLTANADADFIDSYGNTWSYTTKDGDIKITGVNLKSSDMIIPAEIEGHTVTEFGADLKNNTTIKTLTMPDTLEKLTSDHQFMGCTNLTKITFSKKLSKIPMATFNNCSSLTDMVNFADSPSIKRIEDYAFGGCESLGYLVLPPKTSHVGEQAFGGCTSLRYVVFPDVTYLGFDYYPFMGCNNLNGVFIPASFNNFVDSTFQLQQFSNFIPSFFGYVNSPAESYAQENNINFIDITNHNKNIGYSISMEGGTFDYTNTKGNRATKQTKASVAYIDPTKPITMTADDVPEGYAFNGYEITYKYTCTYTNNTASVTSDIYSRTLTLTPEENTFSAEMSNDEKRLVLPYIMARADAPRNFSVTGTIEVKAVFEKISRDLGTLTFDLSKTLSTTNDDPTLYHNIDTILHDNHPSNILEALFENGVEPYKYTFMVDIDKKDSFDVYFSVRDGKLQVKRPEAESASGEYTLSMKDSSIAAYKEEGKDYYSKLKVIFPSADTYEPADFGTMTLDFTLDSSHVIRLYEDEKVNRVKATLYALGKSGRINISNGASYDLNKDGMNDFEISNLRAIMYGHQTVGGFSGDYVLTEQEIGYIKDYYRENLALTTPAELKAAGAGYHGKICAVFPEITKYDLYVCGTQVTVANARDILGNGVFKYNAGMQTLTINGDYNSDSTLIQNTGIDGLVINVTGTSNLTSELSFLSAKANTTLTGQGKLTVDCKYAGIAIDKDVTVTIKKADVSITATGVGGNLVISDNMRAGNRNNAIIFDNSNVYLESKTSAACAIIQNIEFNGCTIAEPVNGYIEKSNNNNYKSIVVKKDDNTSSFATVIKIEANKRQAGDINGDGSITADDAIIAARLAAGYGDYATRYDSDVADMNGDGKVTADDAIIIARYAAGYGNYREIYTKYI